jgi:SsrA-binding protein
MPPRAPHILATNKRAFYDYEVLEKFEVGVELLGHEVKSAKLGRCSLRGSFVHIRNNEAWLTNATIAAYEKAGRLPDYDPTRPRRLLLKRHDLNRLIGKHAAERITIVPLALYVKRGLVKVEIALARGKRRYEKRETIKQREDERRMRAAQRR